MGKFPKLNATEFSKILKRLGFEFIRQRRSRMFFKHPGGNKIIKKDI